MALQPVIGPVSKPNDFVVRRLLLALAVSLCLGVSFTGCATHADRLIAVRNQYFDGNLAAAETILDEAIKKRSSDADVLQLERSVIQLASNRPKEAEQTLRKIRDRFDTLEEGSTLANASSWLTDDTRRGYAGEDYERVLIRAMLAVSNLMHDGGDVEAYSLQMVEKQQQIIDAGKDKEGNNPKEKYGRVALGPYLRGVLREGTHSNYDDATRSFEQVVAWTPEFAYGKEDLQRVKFATHSAKGNGVVHVIAFVGRGPFKVSSPEVPSTVAMAIAGGIVSSVGSQSLPPTVAPIEVPRLVAAQNMVAGVGVEVGGQPASQTETITDVTHLAIAQHEAIFPHIVARAVARRALKKGVVYGAKEFAGIDKGSLTGLAIDLAGAAWEGVESADTRCWGLLPDQIQVCRLELPVGEHALGFRPLGHNGRPMGGAAPLRVQVEDGQNTYVLVTYPGARMVGTPLVSRGPATLSEPPVVFAETPQPRIQGRR
jgi:hypothetical protein